MLELELVDQISGATVAPLCDALNAANPGDVIRIMMPHNKGGEINAATNLIVAIIKTKATVNLVFDRYVISAAAFIWVWFLLRRMPHVTVTTTENPGLVVYHRPRLPAQTLQNHFLFRDDLADGHPIREMMQHHMQLFDELFEELLRGLGWSDEHETCKNEDGADYWHELCHMKRAYYSNRDCVIPALIRA